MRTKLELAKERKLKKKQRQDKLDADIKHLHSEIQRLHDEFSPNEPIDLSELIKQLAELPALIAIPFSKSLEGFIVELESRLNTQKQPDLSKLIKDIQINNDIDLKPLQKELANLKKELKAKEVSQLASDYQPYRRVVKLGSRFYFDDNMTASGGGGGIDTSGLATTAKQDSIITAIEGIGEDVPTTQLAGDKDVAAVATPEALAASTSCTYALVQAKPANTSNCFVGNASSQEVELEPGQAWAFAIDNLNKIYVRVGTNGDGVNYTGGA